MTLLVVSSDGHIIEAWDGADQGALADKLTEGQWLIDAAISNVRSISSLYVPLEAEAPIARPAMGVTIDKTIILANGIDVATLSNVPVGATMEITIGASTTTRVCGESELVSSDVVGDISIKISDWPALDFVVSILAV
ncbi:hypothetical protein ACQE3E_15735 [Methylomonas sp. MED-D]|uniref:hypothetical protein n=1 Tax=unclassified Methylomonas TaxID=2608980 RepID=UPI003D01EC06